MTTPPEPVRNAARNARRFAKFGPNACCLLCGVREPKVLVATAWGQLMDIADDDDSSDPTLRQRVRLVLEEHHVFETSIDRDVTIPLCRNCHGLVHELLRDQGIDFKADPERATILHVLQTALRVMASFHHQLATFLGGLADQLDAFIRSLEHGDPGWGAGAVT